MERLPIGDFNERTEGEIEIITEYVDDFSQTGEDADRHDFKVRSSIPYEYVSIALNYHYPVYIF